ncbi:alpha-ketoglutarate-dependent dioxygenase alkB homolog 7, mitochondrial [Anopheles aquasalis]|uniref:alpha-ketoglutarate-dependent dioxygenase alkB homolog 7, mitochondrial n=1 Tax=Anopheles aquasalis TaxID=42839 RepID=UPI00215B0C2C|nr:alpha-ketoglutarate-dependent dioxygenase alkB homolog 7, mitochondrial [Anopheles aquasalis]XP_050087082.1 alpha-ketoglutarate-dependent dioxygenase alkB homolog 7, mitochondrial [Anopheles aquasalis]
MVTSLLTAIGIHRHCVSTGVAVHGWRMLRQQSQCHTQATSECVSFHGQWPADEREQFCHDMRVIQRFLDATEEGALLGETEPYLKRLRYEFDHWDDAIHGYRETERKHWQPTNRTIIDRIVAIAFNGVAMPYVHVLDLADTGVIKPHVDSVRYCGNIIAGVSLLSDSVMRLVRTNDEEQTNDEYRQIFAKQRHMKYWADVLLPRRSLYIMRDTARYKFTHEILASNESQFRGRPVSRSRRISIICRNEPT